MRGVSVLIAYLLVLGAIITFGIASLMALQPSTKPTPSASAAAVAHKEQAAQPVKQSTQKDAQPNQKRGHVLTPCLPDPPCFGALRFSTLGPACHNAWWQIAARQLTIY